MRLFIFFILSMMFSMNALANSANSIEQPIPPVLMEMARCDVVSNDPSAGKLSFDVYISVTAMDQNSLQSVPGAIVQTGLPFFGDMKLLYTTARITLSAVDIQPITFKVELDEDSNEPIILNADLFEVDGSLTGAGVGELGSMGTAPLKCTLTALRTKKH